MRTLRPSLVALGLGASVCVLFAFSASRQQSSRDRWEYVVRIGEGSGVKPERQQAQLDSLGRDGWELVSVVGLQAVGSTGGVVLYLKRRAS